MGGGTASAALCVGMALSGVSHVASAWGAGQGQQAVADWQAVPAPDGASTDAQSGATASDTGSDQGPAPTVSHTVTFNSAGGTPVPSQVVLEGSCASVPEAPVRDGDVFRGWYVAGSPYDFSRPILSDVTLVARWRRTASNAGVPTGTIPADTAPPTQTSQARQTGATPAEPEGREAGGPSGEVGPETGNEGQGSDSWVPADVASTSRMSDTATDDTGDADDSFPEAPASDAWDTDPTYRRAMEQKAKGHEGDTDTDWCVTFDCDLCRCCVVHRDPDGHWHFVRGWDCDVGPIQPDGRSQSMRWNHLTKVVSKWQDSGDGMDVNPWKLSLSGIQTDFGWHGTWGTLQDNRAAAGGTAYNTGGGMVVDNGPAKWMYDNLPMGTEVVVFDHVEPK